MRVEVRELEGYGGFATGCLALVDRGFDGWSGTAGAGAEV